MGAAGCLAAGGHQTALHTAAQRFNGVRSHWGPDSTDRAAESLPFPMSFRAIGQFAHWLFFPVRVMLFPSGDAIHHKYLIRILKQNVILFKLNGEHAGKGFMLLGLIGFETGTCKLEKIADSVII